MTKKRTILAKQMALRLDAEVAVHRLEKENRRLVRALRKCASIAPNNDYPYSVRCDRVENASTKALAARAKGKR